MDIISYVSNYIWDRVQNGSPTNSYVWQKLHMDIFWCLSNLDKSTRNFSASRRLELTTNLRSVVEIKPENLMNKRLILIYEFLE